MTDRKKVIKGLRCLSSPYAQDMDELDCENCQYDNASCILDITDDALELLKEQEPQPVIFDRKCEAAPGWTGRKGFCPKCHQVVLWMVNREYCGFCGQAVKWDD